MKWSTAGNSYHNYQNDEKSAATGISYKSKGQNWSLAVSLPIASTGHYLNDNARRLANDLLDNKLGIQGKYDFEMEAPLGDARFVKFLEIINQHEIITFDVYCDLLKKCGCMQEAAIHEIKQLIEDDKFDDAISLAEQQQEEKRYEVIWSLATLLSEKFEESLQDAVCEQLKAAYTLVSKNSPHFKKANEELYNLNLNKIFESEDARQCFLFEKALNSGNQSLIRNTLGGFLGVGMALPPELIDIQLNISTLVQVAGLYKGQGEEIKGLKEANQQLQQNSLARKVGLTTQSLFKMNFGPRPAGKSVWPGYK